jgi:hypothetical protein
MCVLAHYVSEHATSQDLGRACYIKALPGNVTERLLIDVTEVFEVPGHGIFAYPAVGFVARLSEPE